MDIEPYLKRMKGQVGKLVELTLQTMAEALIESEGDLKVADLTAKTFLLETVGQVIEEVSTAVTVALIGGHAIGHKEKGNEQAFRDDILLMINYLAQKGALPTVVEKDWKPVEHTLSFLYKPEMVEAIVNALKEEWERMINAGMDDREVF